MDHPVRTVTVITRVGCHLCTEAESRLVELSAALEFDLSVVDVDSSRQLANEYSDRVPVILIDGREHGYWRLEEARFLAAVAAPPRTGRTKERPDGGEGPAAGRSNHRSRPVK